MYVEVKLALDIVGAEFAKTVEREGQFCRER